MSNPDEGFTAPEERVNIVYRPATGGAKEDVELPLKLLVAGDFTGAEDARPIEQREPVNIDKDNFNNVLEAHHVRLECKVPDRLSGREDSELSINLAFSTMDDFGPERVAAQIPQLQALMEIRQALSALKGPLANVPEFRNKIQNLLKDSKVRTRLLAEINNGNEEVGHE